MLPVIIALAFVGSSSAAQEKDLFQLFTLPPLIPPFYTPLRDLLRGADLESITCTITMSITIGCSFKRDGDQHFINFLGQDFPVGGQPLAGQEDISGTITIDFGKRVYDCGFNGINPVCIGR
ncbi:uncharacterized protein LOC131936230 [Physella acuta]|uniref:uncharacterized protein LOC131936230 n=1 Tax=Physella acuta TaxID=109671 RepID=UPI0027DC7BDB|nr:uncharacterized protein LOC131936230 [Physella acuta]